MLFNNAVNAPIEMKELKPSEEALSLVTGYEVPDYISSPADPVLLDKLQQEANEAAQADNLSKLVAQLKLKEKALSEIKTDDDIVRFLEDFAKKNGLTVDVDIVKKVLAKNKEKLEKISEEAKELSEPSEPHLLSLEALKVALTVSGVLSIYWFSGPYAAVAARELYTKTYASLYGPPSILSLSYYTVYLPGREHVSALAYQWAPWVLNIGASPILYKTVDAVQAISLGISSAFHTLYDLTLRKEETVTLKTLTQEDKVEPTLDEEFEEVLAQMQKLTIEEKTTNPRF